VHTLAATGQYRPTKDGKMATPAMLPETGYLRLKQVLAVIPVSKSTWWAGVSSGRYPQPTRALGVRITAWSVEGIRELIEATAPKAAA
jgi:prophage regulatory protein